MCTPAKGSRDATINTQGRVLSVRAPIIRFQYPALTCSCVGVHVCRYLCFITPRSIHLSLGLTQRRQVSGRRKLADRLRHEPMHYSSAVRERASKLTTTRGYVPPGFRSLRRFGNIRAAAVVFKLFSCSQTDRGY